MDGYRRLYQTYTLVSKIRPKEVSSTKEGINPVLVLYQIPLCLTQNTSSSYCRFNVDKPGPSDLRSALNPGLSYSTSGKCIVYSWFCIDVQSQTQTSIVMGCSTLAIQYVLSAATPTSDFDQRVAPITTTRAHSELW